MKKTYQKKVGDLGEELVAEYYKKQGYKIIGRNVKIQGYKQLGEIDIIARRKDELVFVEVKTRGSDEFMDPIESIDRRKIYKLKKAVMAYTMSNLKYEKFNYRVDVAVVKRDIDGVTISDIIENVIQDF